MSFEDKLTARHHQPWRGGLVLSSGAEDLVLADIGGASFLSFNSSALCPRMVAMVSSPLSTSRREHGDIEHPKIMYQCHLKLQFGAFHETTVQIQTVSL